ncbi:MAG: phosphatidylserine/phosphatidylglycerophosphate/cardiolipin synthase family protein [Ginsengibacter sp.]
MSSGSNHTYYTVRNKVKLIRGGSEYFELLLDLIHSATHSIHLQFYIYDDDSTGVIIGKALMDAAKRNVKVYFMADGYASQVMASSFINRLRNAGIYFKYFEPLFRSTRFYLGRRMHQKVIVIDGRHALVGGVNISNRYNDMPGTPAWMDFALYVQGEAAVQLYKICNGMWENSSVKTEDLPADIEIFLNSIPKKEYSSVRVRVNDWVKYKNQVWKSYFELFNQASKSIIIMCSYFLPGWELMRRLSKASTRGVKIKVILAGPCDVRVAKNAERYLYTWMLKNNIEIYEYQPNILHAKIAVADGRWLTVGSYNINNISAHASIEVNLDVRNKLFAQKVEKQLLEIIVQDCVRVTSENYEATSGFFKKLWQWASYLFIKMALRVFTFYFKREIKINPRKRPLTDSTTNKKSAAIDTTQT